MVARQYTKRIELRTIVPIDDGYGGFVIQNVLTSKKWANIVTKTSVRSTSDGNIENFKTIAISFRGIGLNLNVKTNYINYKNTKYVIDKVENVDLDGIEVTVFCTQSDG